MLIETRWGCSCIYRHLIALDTDSTFCINLLHSTELHQCVLLPINPEDPWLHQHINPHPTLTHSAHSVGLVIPPLAAGPREIVRYDWVSMERKSLFFHYVAPHFGGRMFESIFVIYFCTPYL